VGYETLSNLNTKNKPKDPLAGGNTEISAANASSLVRLP
jgi:hypothetical protein